MCGIKIKGVFETIEEAQLYAKKITQLDPLFDIFLVEMYKWLPVPPNSDLIENQNFQDEVLNTIVKTHVEEQYKAKQFFETRKLDLMGGKTDPIEDIANLKIDESVDEPVVPSVVPLVNEPVVPLVNESVVPSVNESVTEPAFNAVDS